LHKAARQRERRCQRHSRYYARLDENAQLSVLRSSLRRATGNQSRSKVAEPIHRKIFSRIDRSRKTKDHGILVSTRRINFMATRGAATLRRCETQTKDGTALTLTFSNVQSHRFPSLRQCRKHHYAHVGSPTFHGHVCLSRNTVQEYSRIVRASLSDRAGGHSGRG